MSVRPKQSSPRTKNEDAPRPIDISRVRTAGARSDPTEQRQTFEHPILYPGLSEIGSPWRISNTMATQQLSQPTTPEAYLDLGITLAINNWPALTLAVQSLWGGPTSSDKRDWLCGAISDMLSERPETDAEDLEDVLIQVMNDEFDVVVEDESAAPIAAQIMEIKKGVEKGDFGAVQELMEAWQKKSQQKANNAAAFKKVETNDDDQETDDEEDDDDNGVGNGDVDMDEAPSLVRAPKEKVQPEVDEDGFTKVVGKKR